MRPEADDDLLVRAQGRVGTLLRGKYRIDGVLGVGGMAVVYAATHRNKKRFAVKVLHPELSFRADLRARFLREGYAANSVEHAGTVAVLDDDVAEDGGAFLVMELLEGETVEERWERSGRRLPLDALLSIGYELLDVLAAAHARGIVHRDIKPANLFLTFDGRLKVLDFGIARLRDIAVSQATQMGALIGTPSFMAPEQALGITDEVDAQTDLWATGATLFTLASGRMVHEAATIQAVIVKAATQPAPSLAAVLPGAPSAVVQAVDRALVFDKAQRWASAGAMRDALREASLACFGRIPSLPPAAAGHVPPTNTLSSERGRPSVPVVTLAHSPASPPPLTTAPVSSDSVQALPGLRRHRRIRVTLAVGTAAMGVVLTATLVPRLLRGTSHGSEGAIAGGREGQGAGGSESGGDGGSGGAGGSESRAAGDGGSGGAGGSESRAAGAGESGGESTGGSGSESRGGSGSESRGGGKGDSGGAIDAGGVSGGRAGHPYAMATAHKPDCKSNFYFDAEGEKHFKPQCFPPH